MNRFVIIVAIILFGGSISPAQNNTGFTTQLISSQWNQAVGLTFNSNGNAMFVWERIGKIWVVENNVKTLILDISEEVGAYGDLGLVGFVLDPNFDSNGYIYLFYTVDRYHLLEYGKSGYSSTSSYNYTATINRLTRYTASKIGNIYNVNTASRKILLGATITTGIPSVAPIHGPGALLFGTDGTLLISAGDGANAAAVDTGNTTGTYYSLALSNGIITQQENVGAFRAQMIESYCGKILRIDPLTGNGVSSNPFYDAANPGSPRSKVWTLGLRNGFRMSIKPGTGSTNRIDGNPGTIYLGDVGHTTWEELDVVDKPGMNLGWPIFEGLTLHSAYPSKNVYNRYAPNPAYGLNGCTQQYFYFRDLIKEGNASGTATFTNPCNGQPIPTTVKTFIHRRPIIDWKHGTGPSRCGTFTSGGVATTMNIGAAGSPVSGPQFSGNCAVGGVFYTYDDFPSEYKGSYIFADYGKHWIRRMSINAAEQPISVSDVIDTGAVVALAINPVNGGIYYIDYTSSIKRIIYNNNNLPPVAIASSNKIYGIAPLTVTFTANNSYDPEGKVLSYQWDFGDGTTANIVTTDHTFSAGASTKKVVILTVTDDAGATARDSINIYVNSEPPQVTITSPAPGSLYSMNGQTTFQLRATATDKEDPADQLRYEWQAILHHDEHEHPEPVVTTKDASAITSPLGCGVETYYYRIILKVTDLSGLSTTKEVDLYPYCDRVTTFTLVDADADKDIQTLTDGTVIDLRILKTKKINIRANTNPSVVARVQFNLSGAQSRSSSDNSAPYSLYGDNNGNYNGWSPPSGSYVLKAVPYTSAGAGGLEGTISFKVAKNGTTTASASILDETYKSGVKLLPNPFTDHFIIETTSNRIVQRVVVYDVYGKLVTQMFNVQTGNRLSLGKSLAAGLYIVSVEIDGENFNYKMIKDNR